MASYYHGILAATKLLEYDMKTKMSPWLIFNKEISNPLELFKIAVVNFVLSWEYVSLLRLHDPKEELAKKSLLLGSKMGRFSKVSALFRYYSGLDLHSSSLLKVSSYKGQQLRFWPK